MANPGKSQDDVLAERYRALWDSHTPLLVINRSGNYVDANEAGLAFLEVTREQLLSLHVCDVIPAEVDCAELLRRHRTNWEQGGRVEVCYDIHGKRKYLDLTIAPLKEHGDEVFGIGREITGERVALERLSTSGAILKAVLDDVPDLICRWRPDGTISFVNHAYREYFSNAAPTLVGANIFEHVSRRDRALIEDHAQRMTPQEPVARYERQTVDRKGRLRWQRWVDHGLFDGERLVEVQSTGVDVTDEKERTLELERVTRTLRTLSCSNSALIHARDEQRLLSEVCRHIVQTGGYRMAWVGLLDAGDRVGTKAAFGAGLDFGSVLEAAFNGDAEVSPLGAVIEWGETAVFQALPERGADYPWSGPALALGFQALAAIPLVEKEHVFGALAILSDDPRAFQPGEVKVLLELGQDMAYGVRALRDAAERDALERERVRQSGRLQDALVQTIQALTLAIEKRDPYTAGHQTRVAQLAVAIAKEMNLAEEQVKGIRLGALVHDIGKIAVPSEYLSRPGTLSALEFSVIKPHPDVGHEIMAKVPFPWPVADMVWEHHERLDGSGYPRGLKDGAIRLESRIIAVADAMDAATNHRPYRPGKPLETVLGELEADALRFDPAVVATCARLFREKKFEWR